MGEATLWTPDRNVPVSNQRDVQLVSPKEMKILEDLDAIAHRLKLCLICPRCDTSFQGQNSRGGRTSSIFCKCREIKCDTGNRIVPGNA